MLLKSWRGDRKRYIRLRSSFPDRLSGTKSPKKSPLIFLVPLRTVGISRSRSVARPAARRGVHFDIGGGESSSDETSQAALPLPFHPEPGRARASGHTIYGCLILLSGGVMVGVAALWSAWPRGLARRGGQIDHHRSSSKLIAFKHGAEGIFCWRTELGW